LDWSKGEKYIIPSGVLEMDFVYRLTNAFGWAEIQFSHDNFSRTYPVEYCLGDNLEELLGGLVALTGYRKEYKSVAEIIEKYLDESDVFEWIASVGASQAKFIFRPLEDLEKIHLSIIEYFYNDIDEISVFDKDINLNELIDSILSSCNALLKNYGILGYYENYWVQFPVLYFLLLKDYREKKINYNMIREKIDGKDEEIHKTSLDQEIEYFSK
jgi:hypothetical protein